MLGDSAYNILDWHGHLLAAGVVPVAPYNPRNTDNSRGNVPGREKLKL